MSTGTDSSSSGHLAMAGSDNFACTGNDVRLAPVVGSIAAQLLLISSSPTPDGLLPSARVVLSAVQRTRQPRAIGNNFGTAMSAADAARGSSGMRITPGCATE